MSNAKDSSIDYAKAAEQAERFDDMARFMKAAVNDTKESESLSTEERNLLGVAYKNAVEARRKAWRVISSIEQKEPSKRLENYRAEIERELKAICEEGNSLVDRCIKFSSNDTETKVFYQKMKGDFYRYHAEISSGDEKVSNAKLSREAYEKASGEAKSLPSTNPIVLGVALNFSVFCYEIENKAEEACTLAKTAFDKAIEDLDNIATDNYKDSSHIMQLLKDNLTLWTSDQQDDGGLGDEDIC